MKQIIIVCIVAAFASSCKKDYSCVCTTVDTSSGVTQTSVSTFSAKSKKKDAEAWCAAVPKATIDVGGTVYPATGMTCEIK